MRYRNPLLQLTGGLRLETKGFWKQLRSVIDEWQEVRDKAGNL